MRLQTVLATFSLLTGLTVAGHATTIFSENFEGVSPSYTIGVGGAVGSAGFTVTSGNVDLVGNPGYGFLCTGLESGNCVDLDGLTPGTISYTLSGLTVGQQYIMTFDLAGNDRAGNGSIPAAPLQNGVTASFGGASTSVEVPEAQVGTMYTLNYTATSTSAVISFASLDQPNQANGAVLDNVLIQTASSTPEPLSMMLFGSGFLAISLIGRKKLVRK